MARRRYQKSSVNKSDYARAVLTDTTPYEVPIIFSNDGFYKNCLQYRDTPNYLEKLFEQLVVNPSREYTIPLSYKIRKNELSLRTLSLLHPHAQWGMVNFYKQYSGLICYYCSISKASLRYPKKIGSAFYYRNSNENINKYKHLSSVDTQDKDKFAKNPASYFSYGGYDRLYKFFESSLFIKLEKKYSVMWMLDVSKCFDSVYTHSISWAIKTKEFVKEHKKAQTFGDSFDTLMQKSNYNETNGICIGAEISRIFAEIIFQDIDSKVINDLEKRNLFYDQHYSIKRYVDDIFVFAKDEETIVTICKTLSEELSKYKFHLNEGKVEKFKYPFFTKKSKVINSASIEIDEFSKKFTEAVKTHKQIVYPIRIFRESNLVHNFIRAVKSLCHDSNVGYDMVANYLISSLAKRIERLIEDRGDALKIPEKTIENHSYMQAISVILEVMFFFYTVVPSVGSSYHLSKSIVLSSRFFEKDIPEYTKTIKQRILELSLTFLQRNRKVENRYKEGTIPLEMMNIFLALSDIGEDYLLPSDFIIDDLFHLEQCGYLELTSCLYYIKNHSVYNGIKDKIKLRILAIMGNSERVNEISEKAYLLVDILTCPYLDVPFRKGLLDSFRKQNSMTGLNTNQSNALIAQVELTPWFINWKSIDLLNMLEKKELSAVY